MAFLCGAAAYGQQPARDASRVAGGSASISGTVVVGGDPKQPARRVRVTLTNVAGSSPGQTATTDDSGAFAFRGLPAGRFELQAFRNAYLRASYGASRPDRAGTPVVVKDGETVTNLSMTIVRGGVITGVVRDGRGRPVPGVNVRAVKFGYNAVTGEPSLHAPSDGSAAVTDDRGEYRVYGLPPGGYLVLVAPPTPSARFDDSIRQLTSDDVRRARSASPAARVNYAAVFFPGVTDIRAAGAITLGTSEERTGIDIPIQLVPTATVSGIVNSPAGALPPSLFVALVPSGGQADMLAGAGLRGLSGQLAADGKYTITSVPPGTYTLKTVVGRGRGAVTDGPTQWAAADITVSGQDLDVPLTLQPGVAINGRVAFEGSQPAASELQTLWFALVPPGTGGTLLRSGGGRVGADGRFTFAGVTPDAYRFVMSWNSPARDTWIVKSSTANGREAFEAPLRVNPNETLDWVLTFTDTPTGLSGALQDPAGRPATDYYVLVFSVDRRYWTPGSRRVRMTRPASDGSYSVKGLPPGEYHLAAPLDLENGEWNDPALLEQLLPSSAKVTLREGEMLKKDFRIGGV